MVCTSSSGSIVQFCGLILEWTSSTISTHTDVAQAASRPHYTDFGQRLEDRLREDALCCVDLQLPRFQRGTWWNAARQSGLRRHLRHRPRPFGVKHRWSNLHTSNTAGCDHRGKESDLQIDGRDEESGTRSGCWEKGGCGRGEEANKNPFGVRTVFLAERKRDAYVEHLLARRAKSQAEQNDKQPSWETVAADIRSAAEFTCGRRKRGGHLPCMACKEDEVMAGRARVKETLSPLRSETDDRAR